MRIKTAARYASVSQRTLRSWLKKGLVHSRLPSGTVFIHPDDIDNFLTGFRVEAASTDIDTLVDSVIH